MSKTEEDSTFSQKDLLFIADSDFLKTKRIITKKIERLLIETQALLKPIVVKSAPAISESLLVQGGKISRGENYRDLPYQVLDYPRLFTKESVFSYRSMFWWGNFFSCTLHLQGEPLNKFRTTLARTIPENGSSDIFFCINNTPWEYHYETSNYLKLEDIPVKQMKAYIDERPFIKLSRKLPLHQYKQLPSFALATFELYYKLLHPTTI